MPVIRPGQATKPTSPPKKPVYPLFPATGDIQQIIVWDSEAFVLHTTRYKYWILNVQGSKPDHLYGEPTEQEAGGEVYAPIPVYVHAYAYWDETERKELQKFGIVSERDVVVEFSIKMLADLREEVPPDGLTPKRGDVIVMDNTEFVIDEVKRGQPWFGNIQYPIHYYCPCTKRKLSNITDDRADATTTVGPEHPAPTGPSFPSNPDKLYGD
jgi:hypothetical protein